MPVIATASIAFGLVSVPVRIRPAADSHDIRFHQVHAVDGGRIQYARDCTLCGAKAIPYYEIDRCYESPAGHRVIVTDDDLAALPAAKKSEIPVLLFVPADQLDPMLLHRAFYLEPAAATPRAYALLAAALERTDRIALCHMTLRQKTRLAALRVRAGVLVLQTLLWPDEVRKVRFRSLHDTGEPNRAELAAAEALAYALSGDFDPAEHTDDYQLELKRTLDRAIAAARPPTAARATTDSIGGGGSAAGVGERDAEVEDLIAALRRSVDQATEPTT